MPMKTPTKKGRKTSTKDPKAGYKIETGNNHAELIKELWQAAVNLRGSIEPADYKRYVLPIIFLRFLSLRYEKRRDELESLVKEPGSGYSRSCQLRTGNTDRNLGVPVQRKQRRHFDFKNE